MSRAALVALLLGALLGPACGGSGAGASRPEAPLTPADQAALQAASSAQQAGLYERVHGLLGPLLERDPVPAAAQFVAGYAAYELGDYGEAVERLSDAVTRQPDRFLPAASALGFAQLKLGSFDDARSTFAAIVAADPRKYKAHYGLGLVALEQGRLDDAQAHLARALELSPGYLKARFARARLLDLQGHPEQALADVQAVLAGWPSHEEALYLEAQVLDELGRDEEAQAVLDRREHVYAVKESIGAQLRLIREGQDSPQARLAVVDAFLALGDRAEAASALAAARARFPDDPVLREVAERLAAPR